MTATGTPARSPRPGLQMRTMVCVSIQTIGGRRLGRSRARFADGPRSTGSSTRDDDVDGLAVELF